MRAYNRVLLTVLIGVGMAYSQRAGAQWSLVASFPGGGAVGAVYFLDDFGAPNVGLVGVGTHIYRTVDGGTTWSLVLSGLNGFGVSSFAFKNASVGWCSVMAASVAQPSVFETTDGGLTWLQVGIRGLTSDVYYNSSNGLLFVGLRSSSTLGTSLASANEGGNWTPIASQYDENGFTFCNAQEGILTAHTNPFYRTSDGGVTWYDLGFTLHSWAAAALPQTSTIVAAEDMTYAIFASTDAGVTWSQVSTLPSILTGCVQAGPCNTYVQTSDGIYNSGDLVHWLSLGGPGNTIDTRFFVGSKLIYAGDGIGNLYSRPSLGSGWPTLEISPDKLSLVVAAGCPAKPLTATFRNITCLPLTILSAAIPDSAEWKLSPDAPVPIVLQPEDTVGFTINVRGDSAGTFHDYVQLWIQTTSGITDTILPLNLQYGAIVPPTLRGPKVTLIDRCTEIDTVMYLRNNHCDTIEISSLSMLDTTLYHLPILALPIRVPPDSQIAISLRVRPKARGNFSDTVAFGLSYGTARLDTTLALHGTVPVSAISATLSSPTITFDTVLPCGETADTVYLRNTSCDSIVLAQVDAGSSAFFLLDSIQGIWIPPGDSIGIPVLFSGLHGAGSYSNQIDFFVMNGGTSGVPLTLTLLGFVENTPSKLELPAELLADSISRCVPFDTTIYITAMTVCDSIAIASISTGNLNGITLTITPPLPATIRTGDTIACHLHCDPARLKTLDGTIQVQGPSLLTSVPVHFSFRGDTQSAHIAIARTAFVAQPCGIDSETVTISNTGCVGLVLDAASIANNTGGFSIGSLPLPFMIPGDSSVTFRLYFAGNILGMTSEGATLYVHDSNGHAQNISLTGTVTPIDTARIGLQLATGSTLAPIPGGAVTPLLFFADTVTSARGLQGVRCILHYNGDVLGNPIVKGFSGWNVTETDAGGVMDLECTRSAALAISPGEPMAAVSFEAYLSDSVTTPITLSKVVFTPDDANYELCTLGPGITAPTLNVQLSSLCGDSLMIESLRKEPLRFSIEVQPEESDMLVSFRSVDAASVSVVLYDAVGRVRKEIESMVVPGTNVISVPTVGFEQGLYFVEVSQNGEHAVRQAAILR